MCCGCFQPILVLGGGPGLSGIWSFFLNSKFTLHTLVWMWGSHNSADCTSQTALSTGFCLTLSIEGVHGSLDAVEKECKPHVPVCLLFVSAAAEGRRVPGGILGGFQPLAPFGTPGTRVSCPCKEPTVPRSSTQRGRKVTSEMQELSVSSSECHQLTRSKSQGPVFPVSALAFS